MHLLRGLLQGLGIALICIVIEFVWIQNLSGSGSLAFERDYNRVLILRSSESKTMQSAFLFLKMLHVGKLITTGPLSCWIKTMLPLMYVSCRHVPVWLSSFVTAAFPVVMFCVCLCTCCGVSTAAVLLCECGILSETQSEGVEPGRRRTKRSICRSPQLRATI